ncbi:MAG: hypothetical protein ACRDOI_10030 [Trebonia sp.]
MTTLALPLDINAPGIVGDRALRALQLIRIGRHPSQVMLVPAQGLWVVTGRGPEAGSNGAGKTVLLGALSLLLGDSQWDGGGGTGPSAARLLFDYDRAHATDSRYESASSGYIAGVFCNAKCGDPVSVWLQILRHTSPYVLVRWADGIHLAEGDKEPDRVRDAESKWQKLKANGTLTVTNYAAKLYGSAPRCLASIRARGSEENQDNGLLALGHGSFRPADLATQIITLAGKADVLDSERDQRLLMQQNQEALEAQKTDYQEHYQQQEAELAQINRRKEARRLSGEASKAWDSYLTLLCLLAYHEAEALRASADAFDGQVENQKVLIAAKRTEINDLPSKEDLLRAREAAKRQKAEAIADKENVVREEERNNSAISDLKFQISTLEPPAKLAFGVTVAAAEAVVRSAGKELKEAETGHVAAKNELEAAHETLQRLLDGTGGPAGSAVAVLRAAGIHSVPLLDLVTLPETDRSAWEGRLSPYSRTVVVSQIDTDPARVALAASPGTPIITWDGPIDAAVKASPADPGILGDLLRRLLGRMPEAVGDWVEDHDLGLEIGGGFVPPLTDQEAAIGAAQVAVDRLSENVVQQGERLEAATQAVARANDLLTAAQAAAKLPPLLAALANAELTAAGLLERIATAREQEEKARNAFGRAEEAYRDEARRRQALQDELAVLQDGSATSGGPQGLTQLLLASADIRGKASESAATAESLRLATGLSDLTGAEAALARSETVLDQATTRGHLDTARRLLRRATEEVLARPSTSEPGQEVEGGLPPTISGLPRGVYGKTHRERLGEELREFHTWCDRALVAVDDARPFELVEAPLRAWLDWHGSDDENREKEIFQDRAEQKKKIEANERNTENTLLLLREAQLMHISTIKQMFEQAEGTLRELLSAVGRDPVALRAHHADIQDARQWLRWEVFPQWMKPGRAPVEYRNPPNTAELIILHLLLATSALASATSPRGRMMILDESGNNLDVPNLRKVSQALRQVADAYGLTMVLACQDIYTSLVSKHSTGMIQLVRSSEADVLNAPPVILQQADDPVLARSLERYLQMGRPTGYPGPA